MDKSSIDDDMNGLWSVLQSSTIAGELDFFIFFPFFLSWRALLFYVRKINDRSKKKNRFNKIIDETRLCMREPALDKMNKLENPFHNSNRRRWRWRISTKLLWRKMLWVLFSWNRKHGFFFVNIFCYYFSISLSSANCLRWKVFSEPVSTTHQKIASIWSYLFVDEFRLRLVFCS